MMDLEGTINSVSVGEVETKLNIVFPDVGSKTYLFYITGKVDKIADQDRISFKNVNLPTKESEPIKMRPDTRVEVYRMKKVLGPIKIRDVIYSSH